MILYVLCVEMKRTLDCNFYEDVVPSLRDVEGILEDISKF